jgi:hypothetical protein
MPASISEAFTSPLNKTKPEPGGYNDVLSKYFPSIDKPAEAAQPQPQPQPQLQPPPKKEKHDQLTENIRTEINHPQSPYSQSRQQYHKGEHKSVTHRVEHRHMDNYGQQSMRHEDCHDQIASILACPYCRSKLRALLSDQQPTLQHQTGGGNSLSTLMSGSNSELVNLFLIVGMVIIIHKLFLSK